jgi:hypothetical protein
MKLILSVFHLINLQILVGLTRALPEVRVGIERPKTNIQAIKVESVMQHLHLYFLCSQTISEKCICYMSWNLIKVESGRQKFNFWWTTKATIIIIILYGVEAVASIIAFCRCSRPLIMNSDVWPSLQMITRGKPKLLNKCVRTRAFKYLQHLVHLVNCKKERGITKRA